MKLRVFVHFVNLPGAMYIAREMFDSFVNSGLIDNAEFAIYCNYGYDEFEWLRERSKLYPKIELFYPKTTPGKEFEIPTIIALKDFCDNQNSEYCVLYLHQKGATAPTDLLKDKWRKQMIDANVTNWESMVEKLEQGFDTAGIFLQKEVQLNKLGINVGKNKYHYAGNFWWAKSSYIKKLNPLKNPKDAYYQPQITVFSNLMIPNKHRFDAEFWVGMCNPLQYNNNNYNFDDIINN